MADALHGRSPHILLWEYSINDHAVSLEAASRAGAHSRDEAKRFGAETMRYMVDYWLRRALSLGSPPPALLMTYLWDKQPATAFKAGNRALCKRMPVPASAYAAQLPVLEQYAELGAGIAALNTARYISMRRHGEYCPLVADSYFHPSDAGHELIAELLSHIVRLFAKSVKERADRKWMWIVPPCKRDNSSALRVYVPVSTAGATESGPERTLRALSYFGMVSPGARLRHTIDGQPVAFDAAKGSFLAQSWGYLQMWYAPEAPHGVGGPSGRWRIGRAGASRELEWRLCAEHVPNERCIGFRCGLEFKMPMKTAAVGWFLALSG